MVAAQEQLVVAQSYASGLSGFPEQQSPPQQLQPQPQKCAHLGTVRPLARLAILFVISIQFVGRLRSRLDACA
eukprot:8816561-Pyramimonas_sp.AAC.2